MDDADDAKERRKIKIIKVRACAESIDILPSIPSATPTINAPDEITKHTPFESCLRQNIS